MASGVTCFRWLGKNVVDERGTVLKCSEISFILTLFSKSLAIETVFFCNNDLVAGLSVMLDFSMTGMSKAQSGDHFRPAVQFLVACGTSWKLSWIWPALSWTLCAEQSPDASVQNLQKSRISVFSFNIVKYLHYPNNTFSLPMSQVAITQNVTSSINGQALYLYFCIWPSLTLLPCDGFLSVILNGPWTLCCEYVIMM